MENGKIDKKLMYFDQDGYRRQLGDLQVNRDILNELAKLYEMLFTGKITKERLFQIFANNYDHIEEAAIAAITKSSKNQMLSEVTVKLFQEKFLEFKERASRLVSRFNKTAERQIFATTTPLEWFAIDSEGVFFIPDTTLAEIRSRCSNYIENEQQQQIYDLLEELAKLNNKIYDSLGKRAKAEIDLSSDHRHRVISDLLTSDSAGNTVVDPQNNFKFLAQ